MSLLKSRVSKKVLISKTGVEVIKTDQVNHYYLLRSGDFSIRNDVLSVAFVMVP